MLTNPLSYSLVVVPVTIVVGWTLGWLAFIRRR